MIKIGIWYGFIKINGQPVVVAVIKVGIWYSFI